MFVLPVYVLAPLRLITPLPALMMPLTCVLKFFNTEVTSKSARKSFNPRFRDDFLATEQFNTLLEAQVLAED